MAVRAAETAAARDAAAKKVSRWRSFVGNIGPGLITGAADDDPSGIATYSIAGAQFGTSLLWTAWLTWPLMAAVQMTCARIGMVTHRGLAGALRQRYPRWILVLAATALFVANTINVAADLSGMADAAETLTRVNSHVWVVLFGAGISWAVVRFRYHQIAAVLKWLALVLFAYVLVAFRLAPDWGAVLRDSLVPSRPRGEEWGMLVAILGTTISPYLFFWQASQEVEESRALGRRILTRRPEAPPLLLAERRLDVGIGTFVSNLVMFFVILATALTLHRHGVTHPETTHEVAQALRPIAGELTGVLYTLGIVGVGLLAIPTLAGSSAYAFAETFGWRRGLDHRLRGARYFYGVIVLSTALGAALDFLDVNPVRALYWSAVVNGLLAPFVLLGVLVFACNRRSMRGQPIPWLTRIAVGATVALLFVCAVAMFVV
jgi:NRAMP (natural resistance-associated macrophage protein)-like metal ion transporter